MNGGADLGGMQGFGPVAEEANEPHFHADWEARAMGIVVALGACGKWNIDQSRHSRESLPPADYLRFPYYRIWIEAVEKMLVSRGMVTEVELKSGRLQVDPVEVRGTLAPDAVWDAIHSLAGAADRPEKEPPLFEIDDQVRTLNEHPEGHTRLPRYARGHIGIIVNILGFHVFPDSSGNDLGDDPRWLYQVRFSAQELWGPGKNPNDSVTLDLWEPHLVKA
ncbi:MAG: nitrile hydratase subunit beta [Rhizobiaceae bacterium]|nr:nitrile hydratase subunit beta [Rhizobiaceae bacterium]